MRWRAALALALLAALVASAAAGSGSSRALAGAVRARRAAAAMARMESPTLIKAEQEAKAVERDVRSKLNLPQRPSAAQAEHAEPLNPESRSALSEIAEAEKAIADVKREEVEEDREVKHAKQRALASDNVLEQWVRHRDARWEEQERENRRLDQLVEAEVNKLAPDTRMEKVAEIRAKLAEDEKSKRALSASAIGELAGAIRPAGDSDSDDDEDGSEESGSEEGGGRVLVRGEPVDEPGRLQQTMLFGETPHSRLSGRIVDAIARHVLKQARKDKCDEADEYCQLSLIHRLTKAKRGLADELHVYEDDLGDDQLYLNPERLKFINERDARQAAHAKELDELLAKGATQAQERAEQARRNAEEKRRAEQRELKEKKRQQEEKEKWKALSKPIDMGFPSRSSASPSGHGSRGGPPRPLTQSEREHQERSGDSKAAPPISHVPPDEKSGRSEALELSEANEGAESASEEQEESASEEEESGEGSSAYVSERESSESASQPAERPAPQSVSQSATGSLAGSASGSLSTMASGSLSSAASGSIVQAQSQSAVQSQSVAQSQSEAPAQQKQQQQVQQKK
jgi:hypothetical protein